MAPERHTGYYNLKEAFEQRGCAFCNILEKSTLKYFDDLLYEGVNDMKVNAELLKSNGYCQRHAGTLLDFKDAMGIALLYQRVIGQINKFAGKKSTTKFLSEFRGYKEKQTRYCPACLNEKAAFERYGGIFVDFIGDFFYDIKRNDAFPFCMEHFIMILDRLAKEDPLKAKELKEIQENNLKNFTSTTLNALIDSYNYQKGAEKLSDTEKKAWIDAVELISGKKFEKQRRWKR